MLNLLGAAPAWRHEGRIHPLPNTLPGWTIALLATMGEWVSRERLMTLLWPDAAPSEAQHNLRVDLHRARTLLVNWGLGDALEAERRRVRLLLPTDVAALRRGGADPQGGGPLLASMEFSGFPALGEWFAIERAAVATLWRDAALARIDRPDTAPGVVLALCGGLLEVDPLDEPALLRLLQALRSQGRAADAQARYAAYRERLAAELGVEPSAALRAFAASAEPAPLQAPVTAEWRAFVGRRLECAELARRLRDPATRLVTLVGPGGVGKSSLARQSIAEVPAPHIWIDLQELDHVDAAAARMAQRLGIDLRDGADAARELARGLGAAPRCVVWDNAEAVIGLADFATRLLAAAPALTVLATSRRPLGATGESLLTLQGLAVPDEDSRDAEAAGAFDAVRLFELRARCADPGFVLAAHVEAVVAIAEAVGGLPLAIELAASWVRLLPPEEMARDLLATIDLLERDGASPAPPARPEHASMRAVLDRSWSLLAAREQGALLALAVFSGGFVAAAAKAVADTPLPVLASLVDKSLLQADDDGRFRMHPLVGADVAARAARDDAASSARRDRHAEHFARALEELLRRHADDDRQLVSGLGAEHSNALAAWKHAVARRRFDLARRMLPAWRRYFEATGHHAEAGRHLGLVPDAPAQGSDALPLAHLRAARAHFLVRGNAPALARPLALEALRVAEAADDEELRRICTSTLGGCALALGEFDEAHGWFEQVHRLNVDAADLRGAAAALNSLGLVALYSGRFDEALRHSGEAQAAYSRLAHAQGVARCWMNIAQMHVARADWAQARQAAQSALQHAVVHDLASIAMLSEFWLSVACIGLNELDTALKHLQRVRQRCTATGDAVYGLKADYHLAHLAGRRGQHPEAAAALLAAARSAQERGWIEDLLYLAIFIAERLREAKHLPQARQLLRSAAQLSTAEGSDAVVRAQAEAALAALPTGDDLQGVPRFEALARLMATSDSLDELARRIDAMTLD